MKTLKTLLIACSVCLIQLTFAQEQEYKKGIFLEIGGNGIAFSLNYERQLTKNPGLNLRVGLGFIPPGFTPGSLLFPVSINYLLQEGLNSYWEFGIGDTYSPSFKTSAGLFEPTETGSIHIYMASIGYRHYFGKERRMFWKLNYTPRIAETYEGSTFFYFRSWVGVSIGKRF